MILALDLSAHTGWCAGSPGGTPKLGLWNLPSSQYPGRQAAAFADAMADAITLYEPTLVVLEVDVSLHRQNANHIAYQQIGMAYLAELVCDRREVRVRQAKAGEARTATLGKSRWAEKGGAKLAVAAWCREQGIKATDHNILDAYVLWRFACLQQGLRAAA